MDYQRQLVDDAVRGNRQAFDALVQQNYLGIYRFALRQGLNGDDAADAAQNAFIKAYLNLSQLREASRFDDWLTQIARNECRMALRSRRDMVSLNEIAEEDAARQPLNARLPSTEEVVLQEEGWRRILQAIDALPVIDRSIALDFFVNEEPYAHIEAAHGLSRSALATRIHRIRKTLSRRLGYASAWILGLIGYRPKPASASGRPPDNTAVRIFRFSIAAATFSLLALSALVDQPDGALQAAPRTKTRYRSKQKPKRNPDYACMQNLKRLGLAVMQYVQDNDDRFPAMDTQKQIDAALLNYFKGTKPAACPLMCPVTRKFYQPNLALSEATLVSVKSPAQTVVFQDAIDHPRGTRVRLYVDGHVMREGMPSPAKKRRR